MTILKLLVERLTPLYSKSRHPQASKLNCMLPRRLQLLHKSKVTQMSAFDMMFSSPKDSEPILRKRKRDNEQSDRLPNESARQHKRRLVGANGTSNKPKGKIIQDPWGRPGDILWFNPDSSKWVSAVHHNDIRGQLIHEAKQQYGNYRFPRERGIDATDETAPHWFSLG